MSPSTEAGRRLLYLSDDNHLCLDANHPGTDHPTRKSLVLAIEAEARAALLAKIESAVTDRMHGGTWLDEAAVLDLIRKAGEK